MKGIIPADIGAMLNDLGLNISALKWEEIQRSPELADFTPEQLLREILEPRHMETINQRYKTNLRLSSLLNKDALIDRLVTGNGRRYNDQTVSQLKSFCFAEDRLNAGVYGVTGAGKSYFKSAFRNEAYRLNYRCKHVDYCDLMDELLTLSRSQDLARYTKRLKYYARIQILFLDDFAISRYSEDGIKILYHLIKIRNDLCKSTMFTTQYAPNEWGEHLSDEKGCYGKLDGIRRRLTTGFTVTIEKSTGS